MYTYSAVDCMNSNVITPVKHAAHNIKQWFGDMGNQELDLPAQSPNINPIEHLLNELERRLRSRS